MKLHALPVHFKVSMGSLSKHVTNEAGHPALSYKSNRQSWHQKYNFALTAAIFGYYHIQLQVKSKDHLRRSLKVFSKLQREYDPESNSWKIYDDKFDDVSHVSESNQSTEDSYIGPIESSSEEQTSCQLSPWQKLSQESINRQEHLEKLRAVLLHVLASEQWNASRLKLCHRTYLVSATNLIHFLALQCLDIQQLKEDLSSVGLLNLGDSNSFVLASITAAIQLLENSLSFSLESKQNDQQMSMRDYGTSLESEKLNEFNKSVMMKRISRHATVLLGPTQDKQGIHIMVTVGREAISNRMLLHDLLKAGASIIRINCAHDDPTIWSEIIRIVKDSSQMLEKPCKILMDLAGPKLRTGALKSGPNVMKISPRKDAKGDVVFPAQVWLSCSGCGPPAHVSTDAVLFVEGDRFPNKLEVGSVLRFVDAKGRRRSLRISKKFSVFNGCGYIGECSMTSYVESGTKLYIKRKKGKVLIGEVVDVPAAKQSIRLRVGDLLTITRDPTLHMEELGGDAISSPQVSCDSGRLFDSVKPGDPIAFDDGKIWGVIQGTSLNEIVLRITHASPKGSKLGSEKSINIPKSEMQFEGLTSKDLVDLDFVAVNADMVGISFIRDVDDMIIVLHELGKRKLQNLGVVLKIETLGAFEKLPLLLLHAMQSPNPIGVMIARGDLAVECGWDQMASIQEEILSICNAAHVPVIWATQVLESLVKSGIPTRAELTDVASGMRANCIMLNKGDHIVEAVSTLNSILCNRYMKNMRTSLKPLLFSDI